MLAWTERLNFKHHIPFFGIFFLLFFSSVLADSVHIIAVGDVLLHTPLQKKGVDKGFDTLWLNVIPEIKSADIAYANLEGPVAEMINRRGNFTTSNTEAYTSYPMFNYPPALIDALKLSGFTVLSTANNHALDRYGVGIDKTVANLYANKIVFTGTRRKNSEDAWYAETTSKDISIAWLACTQNTNGIADTHRQVLMCNRDKKIILDLIGELAQKYDAVIVTPHWGVEFQDSPNQDQQKLASELAEAGALAILGSHPHCVQPMRWIVTKAGKKVFVAYSLGNFVSNQSNLKNRSSGLLSLYVVKKDGNTFIEKIAYQPTYMENRNNKMQLDLVNSKKHLAYKWLSKILGEGYLTTSEDQIDRVKSIN